MVENRSLFTQDEKEKAEQDKVVSLFQFIRELNKMKQKTIYNIRDYPWSFAISDIHDDPDNIQVFYRDRVEEDPFMVESDNDDVLLSIHKPAFQMCPEPSETFASWLLPDWQDFREPACVRESITLGQEKNGRISISDFGFKEHSDDEPVVIRFDENEQRVADYENWLELRSEWVSRQESINKTRDLFSELYRLYFELKRDSETEEMIVANGTLCDSKNLSVKHPVLTHRVKLDYEADSDIIYIRDTSTPTELYSALFQSMEDVNLGGIKTLNEELLKNDYHPLDRNDTPLFLKTLVHQLSSNSLYSDEGIPQNWDSRSRLLLYLEPCYIVRKRLDGTLKAIEQIIENVQDTGEVPAPIGDIVSGGKIEIPEDVGEETIEEQLAAVGGESVDILLSKEANKEQLEIAHRIEYYNAVLVQGPPGTGKTHTIANLMGHFLAQGKSVLVTSQTSKALRVLKDKVDPGMQSLCVTVLDDSNIDMERSVDGINTYMSKTTSHELKRDMDILAGERREIIDKLADVRRKIFALINQECNCIVYNGKEISPSKAAKFVADHIEDLSYIPGKVRLRTPMPLSFEQLVSLYRSNEGVTVIDEDELSRELPSPKELVPPAVFSKICINRQNAVSRMTELADANQLKVSHIGEERRLSVMGDFGCIAIDCPLAERASDLKEFTTSFGKIEEWMKVAAVDGKNGSTFRMRWLTLIDQIQKTCQCSETVMGEQFGLDLNYANPQAKSELKEVFGIFKQQFAEKGKISKLTLMLHKDYEKALSAVKINGSIVNSEQECDIVLHDIEYGETRHQCALYWDELLAKHNVRSFSELDSAYPENIAKNWIPLIQRYLDWYQNDYQSLIQKMTSVGLASDSIFGVSNFDSDLVATDKILSAVGGIIPVICDICLGAMKIEECDSIIDHSKNVLLSGKRGSSRICTDVVHALEERNVDRYSTALAELERIYDKYTLQRNREEMLKTLESVAPQWAEAIRDRKGIHGQDTVPSDIDDAWKWKQLCGIVEEIIKTPFSELQADSIRLSREYRRVTAKYAEKSGWYHLLRRTEADIDMKQALNGWKQTVKRIGKGTGKRAPVLKAEARRLMAKCQNAVPGWIMPINRALDNLNPKINRFDVVIIDEASQADISSLAILYMGKKLIIVGDDKQVSPMAVGADVDKMAALEQMYIKGKIPNSHLYNAKTSIYDIAATTFQPLMLREHFRCVPEIIGFSNMLSYDYKIKPLRDASNSTLLPAVVNYRVADGMRDGYSKTNTNEARAIIALLKACIEQPEYAGKSFGIISLLGDEQVKVIAKILEQEISPKEIYKRNILCGNSANFQGDERDVVFLSVVDSGSGDGPVRMLTYGPDDSYRKRYNVAASRAKDQLWVVDSLDSANDLKPGDIRKMLIDYSLNPKASDYVHAQIEEQAESPFEASVATSLSDRGYHLVQQWKVGAYRLDMVAVCGEKKVVIECDGERWHSGQVKIREDMERQTILERLGWRFIRIRGSEYYRNPEKTINRVIEELEAYEIEPETSTAVVNESEDTELLKRVKNRAEIILNGEREKSHESKDKIIAAALN